MNCDVCKLNKATGSAVKDGHYYKFICSDCKPRPNVSSGHARWARGIDLEDHEADIQQPYNKDGTINRRFAMLYPKQAGVLFTNEQVRKASL